MGRLIDEDAVKRRMHETMDYQDLYLPVHFEMCMNEVPTVEPASPWHSMEDNGPPEENGHYFVYAPSYRGGSSSEKERATGVMISKWTGKHWSIEIGYYKRPGCVTHWMPIEPPKEEEA